MTSCLYCVNPDCRQAGDELSAAFDCQLFLDPRKELERVRAESAVHKLASETLHSELVRVTAHAERLAVMCRPMVEAARDHADHLGVTEAWEAQIQAAEAALADQLAQENKPAEPAGGK